MEYIDAEAQIDGCDSGGSETGGWEDFIDSDLEGFIVNEPSVPFGPRPAEYSSEGEGCSTDARVPYDGERRETQDETPGLGGIPPRMTFAREPTPDPFLSNVVWFWKGTMRGWEYVRYDEPDFIDQ